MGPHVHNMSTTYQSECSGHIEIDQLLTKQERLVLNYNEKELILYYLISLKKIAVTLKLMVTFIRCNL